jgi:hypothetical protein
MLSRESITDETRISAIRPVGVTLAFEQGRDRACVGGSPELLHARRNRHGRVTSKLSTTHTSDREE